MEANCYDRTILIGRSLGSKKMRERQRREKKVGEEQRTALAAGSEGLYFLKPLLQKST